MLIVQGDAECADWPTLIERCRAAFADSSKVAVWAPLVHYTPFDLDTTALEKVESTSLNIVTQTDGIVLALSAAVISRLMRMDYEHNQYGWGIGWAALAFAYANQLIAVVDEGIRVFHPRERGYDGRAAKGQMEIFLQQLTQEERMQYQLLDTYIRYQRLKKQPPPDLG
ncbi:hypothetical protein [Allochromatium palmeri]|uniref:Uncharacterized protein n=1 Tax=Allochromatium palmeri TaxID=231048 RepID=A0A6N8EJS2_9GAMM|nr:hypothetical protein [Allochromatium palmeri]MTW23199.1 hypothetical protein [Allochromatium palmeri]